MGETRVDLYHLLEDLRDAYPGPTEETILTEIIANSLDSGATTITITADPTTSSLTIADDGRGMRRSELARYHDIATSAKTRGAGIGFAGVGIKVALLVCAEVVTETRRGKHHVASFWRLASRHKAPWRWVPAPGLVMTRGTAVRLVPTTALSPLLDPGFIEGVVRRNFQPLLDPALAEILRSHYSSGVAFVLNGMPLDLLSWRTPETVPVAIRTARKRKAAGAGYLVRADGPLPEDLRGVAISAFGKVIKRGWDWLALSPASPDRVAGLIEVPGLAECLTLNKADFIRTGPRGAVYLAHRKAVQEAISRQLALWGDAGEPAERTRRRAARPVERDLEAVLADLAEEFPLLAPLVEQRTGGQRRLPAADSGNPERADRGSPIPLDVVTPLSTKGATSVQSPSEPTSVRLDEAFRTPDRSQPASATGHIAAGPPVRRPVRYGLTVQFESRRDDAELAHLVESTVWVNEAHPAYRRAVASRSEGYHVALAVALALAPLAVDPAKEHAFIIAFLARWGAAVERRKGRRR